MLGHVTYLLDNQPHFTLPMSRAKRKAGCEPIKRPLGGKCLSVLLRMAYAANEDGLAERFLSLPLSKEYTRRVETIKKSCAMTVKSDGSVFLRCGTNSPTGNTSKMTAVFEHTDTNGRALIVLLLLARAADEHGIVTQTPELLADILRLSALDMAGVVKRFIFLVEKGVIQIAPHEIRLAV